MGAITWFELGWLKLKVATYGILGFHCYWFETAAELDVLLYYYKAQWNAICKTCRLYSIYLSSKTNLLQKLGDHIVAFFLAIFLQILRKIKLEILQFILQCCHSVMSNKWIINPLLFFLISDEEQDLYRLTYNT